MHIATRRLFDAPRQTAAGADLRAQAVKELRAAIRIGAEECRQFIYDGMISREHAARGAVMGQYVRIAQHEPLEFPPSDEWGANGGDALEAKFLRRDLLNTMLMRMSGAERAANQEAQLFARV